jgi:hypothetical protein
MVYRYVPVSMISPSRSNMNAAGGLAAMMIMLVAAAAVEKYNIAAAAQARVPQSQ